jgi:DnaK suppressor protein
MRKQKDENKKAAKSKALSKKGPAAARSAKRTSTATSEVQSAVASKAKASVIKKVAGKKKMGARVKTSSIVLPPDYLPSEDEPFMNERQRVYFRKKLLSWKEEILRQTRETLEGLHAEPTQHADLADRATSETDRALELRARDRQRKLIAKIDAAIARIEDGSYGYCEETGEPIGLKRLDARPIATLSVEAQERHERRERVYRED